MKKRIVTLTLIGITILSICSCGNNKVAENDNNEIIFFPEKETAAKTEELSEENTEQQIENETGNETETEIEMPKVPSEFTFADFKYLKFSFSSGAGGWATYMNIHADGSFSGDYVDGEMGSTGVGYPYGTMYQCIFSGQFTQPVKVNDYTYSMQISEINYEQEPGSEEIKEGVKYIYSDVYGLENAEDILIYLPGAPLEELPEEFRIWIGYYDLSYTTDTRLPFYSINNEAMQYGFRSYDMVEDFKNWLSYTEEHAASIENSITNDSLTQTEYNEKAKELYEAWDYQLNEIWDILKQTQDAETVSRLTAEEREWIALKEQAVAQAGAEYEGGTMQSMVMELKAAELTKERVYELLERLTEEKE